MADLRIGSKYRMKKRIGGGSFGEIYSGENIQTHEEVAIKLESVQTRPPQLLYEAKIYRILAGGVGIPNIKWHGVEGDYNVMVIDLLGKSLEELFIYCQRKFSLKTVLMIADQLLSRIEYIHNKSYIHRDIKPDNFIIGTGNNANLIYAIDFGLSKKFRDPRTHQHIPYREGKNLTGTARYASINTHLGIEQSRRDDLEGIAYVLIYFLRGSLPWQGIAAENRKQKYEIISERKIATPVEILCQGMPPEFGTFLSETRHLDFTDVPPYAQYRQMFRELFIREGFINDGNYDWVIRAQTSMSVPFVFGGLSNNNIPTDQTHTRSAIPISTMFPPNNTNATSTNNNFASKSPPLNVPPVQSTQGISHKFMPNSQTTVPISVPPTQKPQNNSQMAPISLQPSQKYQVRRTPTASNEKLPNDLVRYDRPAQVKRPTRKPGIPLWMNPPTAPTAHRTGLNHFDGVRAFH